MKNLDNTRKRRPGKKQDNPQSEKKKKIVPLLRIQLTQKVQETK